MSVTLNRYAGIPVYCADDAHKLNEGAGRHWFKPEAMRFFSSRVSDRFYLDNVRRCSYFVTSERYEGIRNKGPRLYSVRAIFWDTGEVSTIGDFQAYRTSASAHKAAKKLENLTQGAA